MRNFPLGLTLSFKYWYGTYIEDCEPTGAPPSIHYYRRRVLSIIINSIIHIIIHPPRNVCSQGKHNKIINIRLNVCYVISIFKALKLGCLLPLLCVVIGKIENPSPKNTFLCFAVHLRVSVDLLSVGRGFLETNSILQRATNTKSTHQSATLIHVFNSNV